MKITIELDNAFSGWMSDDCGGSGIELNASSAEEMAEQVKSYVMDYLIDLKDEEDIDLEEEVYQIVEKHGKEDGNEIILNVEDLNLAWSYWDDDEEECTDENVLGTDSIDALIIDEDGELLVLTNGKERNCFANICYEDDLGMNEGQYIYNELKNYY